MEKALQEYKESTQKLANSVADTVYNASYVDYVTDRLAQVKNMDISPYVNSIEMPEMYSNAISSVKNSALSGLNNVWSRPELDMVRGNLNQVYQQGVWTYNYWEVEKNLRKNLQNIFILGIEIIEEELKELTAQSQAMYKNPITVWAPERGEIQAELALPFEVKRLDQVPDVSPLVNKVEEIAQEVASYLPDQTTWENVKKSVSDMMPAQSENETEEMIKKYKPSRKLRLMKKGGRKVKKMRKFRM